MGPAHSWFLGVPAAEKFVTMAFPRLVRQLQLHTAPFDTPEPACACFGYDPVGVADRMGCSELIRDVFEDEGEHAAVEAAVTDEDHGSRLGTRGGESSDEGDEALAHFDEAFAAFEARFEPAIHEPVGLDCGVALPGGLIGAPFEDAAVEFAQCVRRLPL